MALTEPMRRLTAARVQSEPCMAVRVLDEVPELADGLDPGQRNHVAAYALAPLLELARGPWSPLPAPPQGVFAAVVLEGLIYLRVESDGRPHGELLGPRDVVSPWIDLSAESLLEMEVSARVMSSARLAWIDHRFLLRTARWPQIHAALVERLAVRARRLELQAAINSVPRIDRRLELTLWHLAGRFGRVTPRGVSFRLPLSHAQLAEMIGSKRPSVTCAVRRLRETGCLQHKPGSEWLLCGPAPAGPVPSHPDSQPLTAA